ANGSDLYVCLDRDRRGAYVVSNHSRFWTNARMGRSHCHEVSRTVRDDSGRRIPDFFRSLLVPTTFLGMTFPVAARLYAKSDSLLGTEISAVYSFNTVGGILGSLIADFILIPHIGSQ